VTEKMFYDLKTGTCEGNILSLQCEKSESGCGLDCRGVKQRRGKEL